MGVVKNVVEDGFEQSATIGIGLYELLFEPVG
jgi:hypothetical protein